MEFKASKEKLKEMLAPRPKVVGGDKLVNYQGMDAYTETLMKTVNNKLDFWSPNLDTTHDTIVGAINEVNDKAKYTDGLAGDVADSFPLSRATEGKVYKEPNSKKYYVCIKNYSGGIISVPNGNFEELSVFENSNKNTRRTTVVPWGAGKGNAVVDKTIKFLMINIAETNEGEPAYCSYLIATASDATILTRIPYMKRNMFSGAVKLQYRKEKRVLEYDLEKSAIEVFGIY